jgi:ankyrin repeat protein
VYKNVAPGVFRKLIKAGAKVDARDKDGMTPLMVAAQQSPRYEMVEALVSAGADVKARDQSGNCVLTYAVVAAQYPKDAASAAYLLLHEGADPNVADTDGWTPLMCAARAYNTGVLRVLLNAEEINPQAKPAAVDARTRHGWTALMIAIGSTDPKVILRGFGAKPAGPAKRADANKKPEDKATAEFLERSEALGAAYAADWACHGQLERVWVLLTHGADPNTRANDGTSIDTLLEGRTDLEGLAIRKLIDLRRSEKASGQKRPKNPMENVH